MMAADAILNMPDLKDLTPLSKRLNTASDELNEAIESIQRKINTLSLGVEVWLTDAQAELSHEILTDDDTRYARVQELGYGRFGDNWALLVRTADYELRRDESDGDWLYANPEHPLHVRVQPLLKTSRQIRVKAVDLIPGLVDALQRSATTVVDAVEKAKKLAQSLE